jgi:hypothetical protein
VAFDLVTGCVGNFPQDTRDCALIEVLHGATVGADEVVMVAPLRDHVTRAAVVQEDTTDDAELRQQSDRAEDGSAAGAAAARGQVFCREVVLPRENGGDDGAP